VRHDEGGRHGHGHRGALVLDEQAGLQAWLEERLTRCVRALDAVRGPDGQRAGLHDDKDRTWMVVPARTGENRERDVDDDDVDGPLALDLDVSLVVLERVRDRAAGDDRGDVVVRRQVIRQHRADERERRDEREQRE